jgi:hypothetical protein
MQDSGQQNNQATPDSMVRKTLVLIRAGKEAAEQPFINPIA